MKLRHNLLFQLLWLQFLCSQAVAQEEDAEYVKVLVGFRDQEDIKQYVRKSRIQSRIASGIPQTKINYEFNNTNTVAMEVTRAELEEMRKDSTYDYIEEDFMVPLAKIHERIEEDFVVSIAKNDNEDEYESYGIGLTQAYRTFQPDGSWDQQCGVYLCAVDSGVFIDNADIPYYRGDGYVDGRSFGLADGQEWYYPRNGNHGTETASIMVASGGNGRGVKGVIPQGPQGSKVCLRVAKVVPNGSEIASLSSILEASEWCAAQARGKPLVINLSFAHNQPSESERRVFQNLYNQGVLLVASAGNEGNSGMRYPASHDSVISVASVNEGSGHSKFSNHNDQVELSAPGENIYILQSESNRVTVGSGTSYSSPFVAGLAARIWTGVPRCTNNDLRNALRNTARRLGDGVPNRYFGYGLIQARNARDMLVNSGCDPYVSRPVQQPVQQPVIAPVGRPTPQPTLRPIAAPSPAVPQPTTPPVIAPSPQPTPLPTLRPVAPLPQPTLPPVAAPSAPFAGSSIESNRVRFRNVLGSRTPNFVNFNEGNGNEPRNQAQNWLIRDPLFSTYSDDRLVQRWVLATFAYGCRRYSDAPALQNWVQYTNECNWYHTLGEDGGSDLCDGNGLYIRLDLRRQNLIGTLPPELSLLSNHLRYIHLLDNQIFGTFPPELGFLSRLSRLELTENNIDGPLPPEIGRLAQLTFMGLGRNNFSGPLPADLDRLRKLNTMGLELNQFTSIPNTIGMMSELRILNIDRNNLQGTIPAELDRLRNLKYLNLVQNPDLRGGLGALCEFNMISLGADCDRVDCPCCTSCHRY